MKTFEEGGSSSVSLGGGGGRREEEEEEDGPRTQTCNGTAKIGLKQYAGQE